MDAVRQAEATMVAIAAADYTRIRTAAHGGRLLTPVVGVHADPERPRFSRVSRYQATSLLDAYRDAGHCQRPGHRGCGSGRRSASRLTTCASVNGSEPGRTRSSAGRSLALRPAVSSTPHRPPVSPRSARAARCLAPLSEG